MKHAEFDIRDAVRKRYAKAATNEGSCCEPSCCGPEGASDAAAISEAIGYSAEELEDLPADANLGLGCGNPTAIASLEEGQTVLDLGAGAGIDCFLAAKRVGPSGTVIGVDMTPEMLERARANAAEGSYENVEFRLGEIEALPVADQSIDVIISNCVLNLSADRPRALRDALRVLRQGGRIVVSDMVSERPIPAVVAGSLDAVAGCLPTPRADYLREFEEAGFSDVRIGDEKPYPVSYLMDDPSVRAFVAEHADSEEEIRAFAASISGAIITAHRT